MSRLLSVGVLISNGMGVASAQTRAAAPIIGMTLPVPKQLFDRYNMAIGGRGAMAAYRSVYIVATVHSTSSGGKQWTRAWYRMPPNRFLQKDHAGADQGWRTGFDGHSVWTTQENRAGELLAGAAAARVKEQADFFFPFLDLTLFKTADSVRATTLDGHSVYQVRVVRRDDRVDTLYFDPGTGYKIAETVQALLEGGVGDKVEGTARQLARHVRPKRYLIVFSDYQQYGRIRLPRVMEEQISPSHFETTTLERVEFDTVDPAMFLLPFELEMRLHP